MENRIFVQFVDVLFLYQRGAEPAFGQNAGDGHEDGGHGHDAELVRIDQPRQDDGNDKGDDLDGALLEQLPEDPRNRFPFQTIVSHYPSPFTQEPAKRFPLKHFRKSIRKTQRETQRAERMATRNALVNNHCS